MEKQSLLSHSSSGRIIARAATTKDAAALHNLDGRLAAATSTKWTQDMVRSTESLATSISKIQSSQTNAWLVAETPSKGGLTNEVLGSAYIVSHSSTMAGSGGGHPRIGMFKILTVGWRDLGDEGEAEVETALIDAAISWAKSGGWYTSLVVQLSFRSDQKGLVDYVAVLKNSGFKEAGLLKNVAADGGVQWDELTLQLDLTTY